MKRTATSALALVPAVAVAHPGHGQPGWFHQHADALVEVAVIAAACLVAIGIVRLLRKALAR
jgi:hypothetical protein